MWGEILYYLFSFIIDLVCAGILLFLMLSHEDIDQGMIEPMNLSDYLSWYQKVEMFVQLTAGFSTFIFGNWVFVLLYLPLSSYNMYSLLKGTYRVNFMFLKDYKRMRKNVERWVAVKLVYYMILVIASLFMFVYTLAYTLGDF